MDFKCLDSKGARKVLDRLLPVAAKSDTCFRSFRFLQKKILSGQTLIQRNNFSVEHLAGFCDGDPAFFVNLYRSRNPGWQPFQAVGFPVLTTKADLAQVKRDVIRRLDRDLPCHLPLEGHINLGISFPSQEESTSFLTIPYNELQTRFFDEFEAAKVKIYHAVKLTDPGILRSRIDQVLSQMPRGFSFRSVSRFNFRRDMTIYSDLVRRSMTDHEFFYPLRPEEDLELLMGLRWIFDPRFFQFLLHGKREVGFLFALPDFNEILKPGRSDLSNAVALLTRRRRILKGRIIYKGILPEYRGQGLFRFLRHQVLGKFLEAGFQEIEGSYIDENNQASLGDAQSTFFTKSHTFRLKTLSLT